jgi:hypothetical protein
LPIEELEKRCPLKLFRAQDDLDWFTGAVVENALLQPLLMMRHDGNPKGLTAFYVDVGQRATDVQEVISKIFTFQGDEIAWKLSPE